MLALDQGARYVFVEGTTDVVFYRKQFERMGVTPELLTADYLDVSELVENPALGGEKQNLLAAATWLEGQAISRDRVVIVVDRDLESLNPIEKSALCEVTDFAEMELYSTGIDDLLHTCHLVEGRHVEVEFVASVIDVCNKLYGVRAWREANSRGMWFPSVARYLVKTGTVVNLEVERWWRNSESAATKPPLEQVVAWIDERRAGRTASRDMIKFDDLVEVLFAGVRECYGRRACARALEVATALRAGLAASDLRRYPLGEKLLQRLASSLG